MHDDLEAHADRGEHRQEQPLTGHAGAVTSWPEMDGAGLLAERAAHAHDVAVHAGAGHEGDVAADRRDAALHGPSTRTEPPMLTTSPSTDWPACTVIGLPNFG